MTSAASTGNRAHRTSSSEASVRNRRPDHNTLPDSSAQAAMCGERQAISTPSLTFTPSPFVPLPSCRQRARRRRAAPDIHYQGSPTPVCGHGRHQVPNTADQLRRREPRPPLRSTGKKSSRLQSLRSDDRRAPVTDILTPPAGRQGDPNDPTHHECRSADRQGCRARRRGFHHRDELIRGTRASDAHRQGPHGCARRTQRQLLGRTCRSSHRHTRRVGTSR